MIRIIRVRNPIVPSADKTTIDVQDEQLPLAMLLARSMPTAGDWACKIVVTVNGRTCPMPEWTKVTPRDGDCVVIAPLVAGGGLLRTLGSIAVLVAAAAITATGVGAPIGAALGFSGAAALSAGSAILAGSISLAGNLLISAVFGPNQNSNKTDSASYDPDGPTSLARSGVVIPKGAGTFRSGGNIIASFTDIAGSDQFVNVLVCHGFGPARSITEIQINGKDIAEYQNVQYFTRLGTNDQLEIAQFNQISNGYPQATQCLAGMPVVVPGTGDLTQALQVDIQFPDGIFVDTNDGNIIPAVITYLVEYSVSGANNWQPVLQPQTTTPVINTHANGVAYLPYAWGVVATDLPPNSGVCYKLDNGPHTPGDPYTELLTCEVFAPNGNHYTYQKACQGEWQLLDLSVNYVLIETWTQGYVDFVAAQTTPCYNRTQILGLAPGKYDVRVTKYGSARLHDNVQPGDNNSPNIGQDMWIHSVNEITYQDLVYPNMILTGVRALATSQLSGQNINVTALIEFGLRSRDEGLMPLELMAYEEDNPACVAADMLVDDLYGGGAWPGVTTTNLERYIDEWIGWAENNDTLVPDGDGDSIRLAVFNGIFDQESDLWSQLAVVGSMSRAVIVQIGTDYGVSVDLAVAAPVQMFTVGNILQDSFSENWLPLDERANQVEIQFADSTRYYRQDNPLVYMDPADQDAGVIVKAVRINARGVTVPAQAWHLARYKQRANQYLLRTGSFKTDTAGIACRLFNVIALQHDVPQWGWGGRTMLGSTATQLILDRNDLPFVAATAYSLMIEHPDLLRLTATISAVAASTSPPGVTLTVPTWANGARVTRAIIAGVDCAVLSADVATLIVSPPPGFVPAAGATVLLYDTDVLESVSVGAWNPVTSTLTLATPLSRVPEEFSSYIYGVTGGVKLAKVVGITREAENRSTIEYIDYDPDVYTIATPVIGETSAQSTSNPGVTTLIGAEILQQLPGAAGTYVGFASLSWRPGPDTVGVNIYATIVGGSSPLPQLVARVLNANTWQSQQASGSTITYTVVGFDKNNSFANINAAPTVTIGALGLASNLLLDSDFSTGFSNWSTSPNPGDALSTSPGAAAYSVLGAPLTAPQVFFTQSLPAGSWAVGQYLMLSGYVQDNPGSTADVGSHVLSLVFVNGTTAAQTSASVTAPFTNAGAGVRIAGAPVLVPPGTSDVAVELGIGGPTVSAAKGAIFSYGSIMVEVASASQTAPSTYTPLNTQNISGVGTAARLARLN